MTSPVASSTSKPQQHSSAASSKPHDQKLSRLLSKVLRHKALEYGFNVSEEGYISVDELLSHSLFQNYSRADLLSVVENNDKNRFSILAKERSDVTVRVRDEDNSEGQQELFIRANQGHSMTQIAAEKLLVEIKSLEELHAGICVHGTSFTAWKQIKASGGLSRMKRNHIHFANGLPAYHEFQKNPELQKMFQSINVSPRQSSLLEVKSGMRKTATVFIFIDVSEALKAGIKLYRSENEVILSPGQGDSGMIPLNYVSKVYDLKTNSILFPETKIN